MRIAFIGVMLGAGGCGGDPLLPSPGVPLEDLAPVGIGAFDTYSGDRVIQVYWNVETTGVPEPVIVPPPPPPPPPPVAGIRVFLSDVGPDEGFLLYLERDGEGEGDALISGLRNGTIYYARLGVYDSTGKTFGVSSARWIVPGPAGTRLLAVAAPQADQPVWRSNVSFSPSGEEIALIRTTESGQPNLFVVSLSDGSQRQVTDFRSVYPGHRIMGVDWSPDGQFLAYSFTPSATYGSIDYRIWRISVDGSIQEPLTPGRVDGHAAWTHGDELVFSRGTYEPPNIPELYLFDVPSRSAKAITDDGRRKYSPAYTPHGDLIAFHAEVEDGATNAVFVVPRTGGDVRSLTAGGLPPWGDIHPCWADGGGAVALASNRSGHYEIWSVTLDGHITQVTRGLRAGIERFNPRVSPDGSGLAFLEAPGDGPFELVVQRLTPGSLAAATTYAR